MSNSDSMICTPYYKTHERLDAEAIVRPSRDFNWDIAVFKVEDRIFRVNRHAFVQHSEVFAGMYLLPSTGAGEGTTNDNPIVLDGYKAADFEALLMILYPNVYYLRHGAHFTDAFRHSMEDTIDGKFPLTKEQWTGVLRVTRPWEMYRIRELAIKTLSRFTLSPVEKVKLARDHRVASWLVEGITSLILKEETLSSSELEKAVGLRTAFRIFGIQAEHNMATIGEILRSGQVYAGISISAIQCLSCHKSVLPHGFKCHSCFKALESEQALALYSSSTSGTSIVEHHGGIHFKVPRDQLLCISYGKGALTREVNCSSCNRLVTVSSRYDSAEVYVHLKRSVQSSSVAASIVRSVFDDEIQEYEV